jgi:serine/threonine-protein kinase
MRLRDIGDARFHLLELDDRRDGATVETAPRSMASRALPWVLAATAALVAAWIWFMRPAAGTEVRGPLQFDIGFPREVEPIRAAPSSLAISSDGRSVAMIGVREGTRHVFINRLDRGDTIEIPNSGGGNSVDFSPDSGSVVFTVGGGTITRLSLGDQQRKVVAPGSDLTGGLVWSPAGIVFSRDGALWIVSAEGGPPRALTTLDAARREVMHDHPVVLPGGHLVLFASLSNEPGAERIESVPIDGGPRSVVVERARTPIWSPTGHLLYARDGAVLATPFDPRTATPRGSAVPILAAGAVETISNGDLGAWLTPKGTLLYLPAGFTDQRVVSVARDGAALALDLPPGRYTNPRISPDGRRLLVESDATVIEALDLARGTRARLTAAASGVLFSTWSSDGGRVIFRRFSAPVWAASDGTGEVRPLPAASFNDFPSSAGPDPDSVIVIRVRPETTGDVYLMSISGAFEPKPLIVTPAYEGGAQLSPDGRWLLYQSNASGRAEIYVRRYPQMDRQKQVSAGGGVQPRWSADSREIYYRNGRSLMAVPLTLTGGDPAFGKPSVLFADAYDFGSGISIANYDVTPGGRFIMLRRGSNGGRVRVVLNWTEELERIVAAGGVRPR